MIARLVVIVLLAALGPALSPPVAATRRAGMATIVIAAERQGDTIEIRASAQLQADTDTAWRVLTAYERYPEFIPDLQTSRVVSRRGSTVIVEQSGDARVWLLPVPLNITFEIVESPPQRLYSRAISGSLRALESTYVLTPAARGARLNYVGRVTSGYDFLGPIEFQAVKQNVARQFQALTDEIELEGVASIAR